MTSTKPDAAQAKTEGEDQPQKTALMPQSPKSVGIHPLVLLSVVDHYNRSARNTKKRVVGVLLGQPPSTSSHGSEGVGMVNASNSFAVPFEEDDQGVWFLDHDYVERMAAMYRRTNARETIVGCGTAPPPVLVVIDVRPEARGQPTDAYYAVEEIHDDGTPSTRTFQHLPSVVVAEEAEEIGVEHLLRDVPASSTSLGNRSLTTRLTNQLQALGSLRERLLQIQGYLEKVVAQKLPINHQILFHLQDIFNLLPDLSSPRSTEAFAIKTNDSMAAIYLAALVRAVIALHGLVDNKVENREKEREATNAVRAADKGRTIDNTTTTTPA
ncbi:26S proteasome nonATPase regulatory subunit 7 putat [Piptocephalis cylindrospora]|uniref:26S proteasome nonATPase regulatory subunit 7 putat n=1 Tax=Piptocephalis cylindrospora TaxID=1907219 RepID=A0A4P9XZH3_9FUNG|nr:26S proteasome nonATPase regulatory subunit 7 putat [Piptocephalis cylindrospora]|eukprot:RKP11817.1 26S proteasome nonATPase regulatory subunit 7 putat [Piptocephalis cylindrospora]